MIYLVDVTAQFANIWAAHNKASNLVACFYGFVDKKTDTDIIEKNKNLYEDLKTKTSFYFKVSRFSMNILRSKNSFGIIEKQDNKSEFQPNVVWWFCSRGS